jgi:hypothetical protein
MGECAWEEGPSQWGDCVSKVEVGSVKRVFGIGSRLERHGEENLLQRVCHSNATATELNSRLKPSALDCPKAIL